MKYLWKGLITLWPALGFLIAMMFGMSGYALPSIVCLVTAILRGCYMVGKEMSK